MTFLKEINLLYTYINRYTGAGLVKRDLRVIILGIIIIFIIMYFISYFLVNSTFLMLLSLILFSIAQILSTIPNTWKLSKYTDMILEAFILFLKETGILKYCLFVYEFQHGILTYKGFKVYTFILGILLLSYIVSARYVLYSKMTLGYVPLYLYLIYTFLLFLMLFRSFSKFSIFIITLIFMKYPAYIKDILLVPNDGENLPVTSEKPQINKHFTLFTKNNYVNNFPPEPPRSRFSIGFNRGVACAGLCLTAFACYHYSQQTIAQKAQAEAAIQAAKHAETQAEAAIQAAKHAERQADYAEVQGGHRTKEDYDRKWGRTR